MQKIEVPRGRTVVLDISLGFNVSGSEFLSQIRASKDPAAAVIATWDVSFETDGTNGNLVATMDDSVTSAIVENTGWMTLVKVNGSKHVPVFDPDELPEVVIFNL